MNRPLQLSGRWRALADRIESLAYRFRLDLFTFTMHRRAIAEDFTKALLLAMSGA